MTSGLMQSAQVDFDGFIQEDVINALVENVHVVCRENRGSSPHNKQSKWCRASAPLVENTRTRKKKIPFILVYHQFSLTCYITLRQYYVSQLKCLRWLQKTPEGSFETTK